jgi:16S rRNA (guanine(966)-N(2))-methyltransferase RsmD
LRETLFNIVDVSLPGCRVLDGFAGTGAVGLEALSRGASAATFVERDRDAIAVIAENVKRCGTADTCTIVQGDFADLARRQRLGPPFDVVFLDPPYAHADVAAVLDAAAVVVARSGWVILEHSRRDDPSAAVTTLIARRTVTSGDSRLTFYTPAPSEPR